jgi:hypothetical protein
VKLKELPSKEYLWECFTYDSETGLLYWKKRPLEHFKNNKEFKRWNTRYSTKEALCFKDGDYKRGRLNSSNVKAHRVIWKLLTGDEPSTVDHIDGNTLNNKIINLRSVSLKENSRNSALSKSNSTGIVGVSWSKSNKAWRAYVGKCWVAHYSDFFEACCARKSMERKLGYHINHGRNK